MSEQKKPWGVVYADVSKGHAVTESGIKFTFAPGCSLYSFLLTAVQHTPVNRVYLVGELPANYKGWLTSPEMYKHWCTQKIGHMLDGSNLDDYVARYEHRVSSKRLDIRCVSRWLGDGDYTVLQARSAMVLITQYLKSNGGASVPMFPLFRHLSGTPSTTFSILWEQYNALEHKAFTPLPEPIRDCIRESTGQGRIEYFGENCQGKIPGLYYYDGIFMYAALTKELPTEVESRDFLNIYAGKQFARYRIQFKVPANWQHIGPFGVRDCDGGWFYPGRGHRETWYETWVDGAELDALISCYQDRNDADKKRAYALATKMAMEDWAITIRERIVFRNGKDSQARNPLDGVVKKLVQLREKMEEHARQDAAHQIEYKLARAGFRNLVLHGIGAFNRKGGSRTYIALPTEPRPAGFTDRDELDDGRIVYIIPEPESRSNLLYPQFSAGVWGRCRARIFKWAMSVPYESLVTIRTDAIATTKGVPTWEDNTEIGKLRRKWAVEKPLRAPATAADFDTLQRKIVGEK